jgi:hypothetical protein
MYVLSLGVSRIDNTLPPPVYALLSGLNAATVGIIALAAVQLADKAITDKLTRVLVFLGGVAGMLYTALWYFPILMLGAGLATLMWDFHWMHSLFKLFWPARPRSRRMNEERSEIGQNSTTLENSPERSLQHRRNTAIAQEEVALSSLEAGSLAATRQPETTTDPELSERIVPTNIQLNLITWKTGIYIITGFFLSFITIMIVRSLFKAPPARRFPLRKPLPRRHNHIRWWSCRHPTSSRVYCS